MMLHSNFFIKKSIIIYTIFIFLFSLIMYFNLLRFYIPIAEDLIPWGDPFTYEMGYYELLNRIRNGDFVSILSYIFGSNWYWLQKILIFFFSPILVNEPYSLCIINYFVYGLASLLIFIYFKEIGFKNSVSVFCSLLIWAYPINYNFVEYSALPIMGLDSTFLGSLYCSIFSYLIFLNRKSVILNQLSFSIFLSAAFVGRGNSITVIIMLLFYPTINFFYNLYKKKNYYDLKYFILPSIIFFFTIILFYGLQLKYILNYYSVFKGFLSNNLSLLLPYIKHIPGIFFFYPDMNEINLMVVTDYRVASISILSHITMVYAVYKLKSISNKNIKLGLNTGLFIFYITFFLNLLLWMNSHISIYNAQLIWAPMRIGLLLVVTILVANFLQKYKSSTIFFLIFFAIGLIFLISTILFDKHKTDLYKNKINSTPENIKKIQSFIKENSEDGKSIILWYDPFLNPRIINYYSLKKGEKTINYYRGKHADDIWNQSYEDAEFVQRVKDEIESIFSYADLIILQENNKNYKSKYAFERYSEFITNQLLNGKINNFNLIGLIECSRDKLLILKRSDKTINFKYIIENKNYKFIYDTPKNIF